MAVFAYTLVVTALIAWVLKKTIGLRATDGQEDEGLDSSIHAETAYDFDDIRS